MKQTASSQTASSQTASSQAATSIVALHLLVNQLTKAVAPFADARKNTFINDVAPCLLVRTNAPKLAMEIRQLLTKVNSDTEESNIRLSAKLYEGELLVDIRKKCPGQESGFDPQPYAVRQMAEAFY